MVYTYDIDFESILLLHQDPLVMLMLYPTISSKIPMLDNSTTPARKGAIFNSLLDTQPKYVSYFYECMSEHYGLISLYIMRKSII